MDRLVTPVFARLWLALFVVFFGFGTILLTVPLYTAEALGRGDVAVGVAAGAASVTALFFGPASGRIADRRGRRPMLVLGAAGMLLGYFALLLEPGLAGVVGIRLFAGLSEAAFVIAAYTVVTDIAPEARRGEAISLATVASYLGLAAGPAAADFLLGDDRYRLVWLVAAGCTGLAAVLVSTLPETRPSSDAAEPGWLPPRGALLPGVILFLALVGFGGFNAFAALYAKEIDFARPGLVFALFGIVVILTRLIGRTLPDRLGPRTATTLACMLVGAGLVVIATVDSAAGLLAGTAVFAVGQALAYPAIILFAIARTDERERSAVVGSVTAFVDVALAGGAMTLGAIAALTGYRGMFVAASLSAFAGLLVVRLSGGSKRAPALADPERGAERSA
jgi:MFS family permease